MYMNNIIFGVMVA